MAEPTNDGNNADGLDGSTDVAPRDARRLGLDARGERALNVVGAVLLVLFALGWVWSFGYERAAAGRGEVVPTLGRTVSAALSSGGAGGTAYLTDATLRAITVGARGASGKLHVQTVLPGDTLHADSLPQGARIVYDAHGNVDTPDETRPMAPGIRSVAVAVGNALKPIADLSLVTMLPFNAKQKGRIGLYFIGSWPAERGARGPPKAPAERYANPRGFIQVTPENQDTKVSEHFRLRHFLTKNQPNVWPKYLVLEIRLVDKLELVLADVRARGIRTEGVTVMSGFRTPSYNVGGGNTGGRADLSRHMFGDAADIYIDNDGNGTMDDLNGDGRVDVRDARVLLEAVERVERAHPELLGGAGVYVACCGHGPFIHVDTRGYRARWTGSGGG